MNRRLVLPRAGIYDDMKPRGFVHWELLDDKTGKVTQRGRGKLDVWWERFLPKNARLFLFARFPQFLGDENAILDFTRNKMADFFIGTSVIPPEFIGIATGTGSVGSGDTTLDTPVDYDGANEAKIADSKTIFGDFTSRLVTQFSTSQANQNIRQIGLFDAANAGSLWAKVKVTINKVSTERLNIYWYITWERRAGLAIKTGASISPTGTVTLDTVSTLTFASAVTVIMLENNSGSIIYVKFNAALDSGTSPTNYDIKMADGDRIELTQEELSVTTLSLASAAATFTMPDNNFIASGW